MVRWQHWQETKKIPPSNCSSFKILKKKGDLTFPRLPSTWLGPAALASALTWWWSMWSSSSNNDKDQNDNASDGCPHATWSTMINNSDSTHPWKCPHHSLGFHPLAVDHEKQKHEEHHEVEDQNEHRQPGRSEKKTVERGPKTRRRRRSLRKWLSRGPRQGHMRCRWANLNQTISCVHTHS